MSTPDPKVALLCLIVTTVSTAEIGADDTLADRLSLRREYNAMSAQIDSLVRAMASVDRDAIERQVLPDGKRRGVIPDGMSLSLIFWADDEARVWINDYLVGETRLTPLEVEIPEIYLERQNRIRVRSWDTDWVESGFLCGLYLKGPDAGLFRVLVSDQSWRVGGAPVREIAYVHPVPEIPGAEVIWGPHLFGRVEMERAFEIGEIASALAAGEIPEARLPASVRRTMVYHTFIERLARLQQRRVELSEIIARLSPNRLDIPVYSGPEVRSLSLTLGRAGPLRESVTTPMAERVLSWSRRLPEKVIQLVYPEARPLKGEAMATPAFGSAPGGERTGEREAAYQRPRELGRATRDEVGPGEAAEGLTKRPAEGEGPPGGRAGRGANGSGPAGRGSRNGLWIPTAVLALYLTFGYWRPREV